ncbi:MAG TPA: hypothetical protein VJ762_14635 [Sphingobium sp.]|nr:hypothetical protein [Sphingobium sp.]
MSRVIHIDDNPAAVEALCAKHMFRISTVEPLLSGGSRLVLLDPREAEEFRILMKHKLILGAVRRSPSHIARQLPPASRWR